jgi:arginine exporter protein ArgO
MSAVTRIVAMIVFFSYTWMQNTLHGWNPLPRAPIALVFFICLIWYGKVWRKKKREDAIHSETSRNSKKSIIVLLAILGISWLTESLLLFVTAIIETGDIGVVYSDVLSLCVAPECANSSRIFHLHATAFFILTMSSLAYAALYRSLMDKQPA